MRFRIKDLESYLKPKPKNWSKIVNALTFNCAEASLQKDFLEVDILPNRSPDLNSFVGLAKEIAILTKGKFQKPKINSLSQKVAEKKMVKNQVNHLVPFYFSAVLENIVLTESPDWLLELLPFYEIQPQNILVDFANFVMLELNAPMHLFDLDKITGQVVVRLAKKGEKFVDLFGKEYTLDSGTIVIADEKEIIALAGIIGGQKAKITSETKRVFIESAVFDHYQIRKTISKLNLTTSAGVRFARKVAPIRSWLALHRLIDFLQKYTSAKVKAKDKIGNPLSVKWLSFTTDKFTEITGIEISAKEMFSALNKIGCEVKTLSHKLWRVKPPLDRLDLTSEIDLIEEILRLHSYAKIPKTKEFFAFVSENQEWSQELAIIQLLCRLGFQETFSYSFPAKRFAQIFASENVIWAQNPISEERPIYRNSLLASLLETIYELQFQKKEGQIFQIGKVATLVNGKVLEKKKIGLAVFGQQAELVFQKLISGIKLLFAQYHLPISWQKIFTPYFGDGGAKIIWQGKEIGLAGMLLPKVLQNLDFDVSVGLAEIDWQPFLSQRKLKFVPYPEKPISYRDLSFWLRPEITFQEIAQEIKKLRIKILESFHLIDLYYQAEKKSFTIRFIFRHPRRSLSQEEIDPEWQKIIATLEKNFHIIVR